MAGRPKSQATLRLEALTALREEFEAASVAMENAAHMLDLLTEIDGNTGFLRVLNSAAEIIQQAADRQMTRLTREGAK